MLLAWCNCRSWLSAAALAFDVGTPLLDAIGSENTVTPLLVDPLLDGAVSMSCGFER